MKEWHKIALELSDKGFKPTAIHNALLEGNIDVKVKAITDFLYKQRKKNRTSDSNKPEKRIRNQACIITIGKVLNLFVLDL